MAGEYQFSVPLTCKDWALGSSRLDRSYENIVFCVSKGDVHFDRMYIIIAPALCNDLTT